MYKRDPRATRWLLILVLWWVGIVPLACNADAIPAGSYQLLSEYNPEQRYFPDKLWLKASNPELLGWSSEKLAAARQFSSQIDTAAVVVIDNGVIVDEWGNPLLRYKCHSMRKSLLNALFGIQIEAGKIRLADTLEALHIDDWNPPLDQQEKQARVSDLLQARSGVYHAAAYETYNMRTRRPPRGSHAPGSYWFYNNWDFNTLVSIFEQQTKRGVFEEFQQRIATPLQMEQFRLSDTGYWYERSKSRHPAYLFRMSARDLARFGLLYLREGKWKSQQIVPAKWIEESTRVYSTTGMKKLLAGYGYLWWVNNEGYAALGAGGQAILVYPAQRVVIVHRVDTDDPDRLVSYSDLAKLANLILAAQIQPDQAVPRSSSR